MSGSGANNLDPQWAQDPQAGLQRQNERLQLLLNLTSRITSNLDLREVLRAISANFREVMRCDGAGIWLPGEQVGTFKLYAFDAPGSKGFVKEEVIITPGEDDPGSEAPGGDHVRRRRRPPDANPRRPDHRRARDAPEQ